MAKIAVIIADLFEDSEYTEPVKAYQLAGHELVNVGLEQNIVTGKKAGTKVTIDQILADADPDDFDALLIPGGYAPDKLRSHDIAVAFVKAFMDQHKPVFAICHGPQLLTTAKTLEGRKVTGCKAIKQDLIYAGAEFLDQEVVVDDNLISSRTPADLPAFIDATLKKLT